VAIARQHLLPRQMEEHGISPDGLVIDDKTLQLLIRGWTREAGVRQLERELAAICRKVARRRVSGESQLVLVTEPALEDWLGPRPYEDAPIEEEQSAGAATGPAPTAGGGE